MGRRINSLQQVVAPGRGGDDRVAQQPGAAAVTGQVVRVCGQSWLGA